MAHIFSPTEHNDEKILVRKAKTLASRKERPFVNTNMGVIGVFGGHIILPLLAGFFLGSWLDEHYPHPTISWLLNCSAVGFIIGYIDAHIWLKKEGIDKPNKIREQEVRHARR